MTRIIEVFADVRCPSHTSACAGSSRTGRRPTPTWSCPSLDISHTDDGFDIDFDREGFEAFVARCCAPERH